MSEKWLGHDSGAGWVHELVAGGWSSLNGWWLVETGDWSLDISDLLLLNLLQKLLYLVQSGLDLVGLLKIGVLRESWLVG